MKANELRIGNKFYLPNGEVGTVSYHEIRLMIVALDKPNYQPIPLTEEWLLKFGFEINRQTKKENNIWRCYSEEGFFEVEQIGDGFFLDDNDCYGTELNYVHQLQNLYFALTSEELTFKSE
jgi:hypothetical protein